MAKDNGRQPHHCLPKNAAQFQEWISTRGGLALWRSVNLSNPGASWTTPAHDKDGNPTVKPTWQAAEQPHQIITDMSQVVVDVPMEVKRFHIGVRRGGQGLTLKVTDGGTRRIRKEVDKAGPDAWYEFDYGSQEAVILKPGRTIPLDQWRPELTMTADEILIKASREASISEGQKMDPGWILMRASMHANGSKLTIAGASTWMFDPEAKGDPVNRKEVK